MPAQFLNILLQKSDPKLSWGFDIVGGREYGLPLTICQVSSNSFSSQYLSRGDEIVQIEGCDASLFTEAEALRFIKNPSKSLDLVILKRSRENPQTAKTPRYQKLASSEKHKTNFPNASADKIAKRRPISEKKNKNYKRSSSVPSKYSYCGVPTYQLQYTVPDVDTNQIVNSIRDRSESPPFWRNNPKNASKNRECLSTTRSSSRVFWKQMETGCTDTECDKEVAQYCRSRRDRWKSRSNSIDSTVSAENTSTTATQPTRTETSHKHKYKIPVQFDYYEHREREQQQIHQRSRVSDVECDKEVAQYSRSRKDRWRMRSNSIDSTGMIESTSMTTSQTTNIETSQEYRYKIPVQFDYYENRGRERQQQQRRVNFTDQQKLRQQEKSNVSKTYLSPYDLKMHKDIILSLQPLRTARRRQTSQTSEQSPQAQASCESTAATAVPNNCSNTAAPPAPPAPAPPPPPPPTMNGSIPTIRLKSEISDRLEPPAKIQNAMMKDKKPFTYTPGGIDLSEIKSPRMQRRIMNNAQTPDDIILPTPAPPVNPGPLPPSALAAMTPQIAIPVFPQNGLPKKPSHNVSPQIHSPQKQPVVPLPPPPQPPKQTMTPPPPPQRRSVSPTPLQQNQQQQPGRTVVVTNSQSSPISHQPTTIVVNSQPNPPHQPQQQNQQPVRTIVITNSQQDKPKDQPRSQVGSIYVPPVNNESVQNSSKPSFPVLREAPTPWLQKNQQTQEDKTPAWVNRNRNNSENEQKEVIYERKPRVQQVQNEKELSDSDKPVAGTRVIPIQIENTNQTFNQTNSKPTSQRWGTPVNNNNQTVLSNQNNVNRDSVANSNKSFNEPDSKPIQSRSFKVIQRITGSEDDNVDYSSEVPYNTENVPLSQLRRLHLCDDDQAFMNKVKSQANGLTGGSVSIIEIRNDDFDVDEDIFLHSETDPRYRGSAIPSKAFRKLQNMTDSGQVIPIITEVQPQEKARPTTLEKNTNEESQKKYIPPSERQAEQDLRKYMGSSIPSRSFRMLQAMTSTQQSSQHTKRIDNIDEDARFLYPNPWPDPPKTVDEIGPFWIHYMYLFDLVLKHSPHEVYPDLGDFEGNGSDLRIDPEDIAVSDFHRDEYSENETAANSSNRLSEDAAKEELIIDEVVKDDSDHEVSLTICIPLRRKSKSVEYHEEVTIKGRGEITSSSESPTVQLDPPSVSESPKNSMEPAACSDTKHLESLDSKRLDSSDTEHSESSSVDFWKEIETDEDVYFKSRSVTPGVETNLRSSAYEEATTDEDGYFKPRSTGFEQHAGSHNCDEVTTDDDGYFQSRPKTPGLGRYSGSPICDELTNNQNEDFDSISAWPDYDEPAAESSGFGKSSKSQYWFETDTDEDAYFQARLKTRELDRNARSPSICDELTTNQDGQSNLIPTGSSLEDPLKSTTCDELITEEDKRFISRPKTPGFERRSESPPWEWDEDGCFKPSVQGSNSNKYQESSNYDDNMHSTFRPKTPGIAERPQSPSYNLSENPPAHPDGPEPSQDSWRLGQDIKNYCSYTSMDSESSNTSSGSTEDLDEPFENSSSSSSDENDSYNVYEFSANTPAPLTEPLEPPIPDTLAVQETTANDRDDDSGMSDAGKGIPETETLGTELRKLSKYQRANTHSRLLRILQEEEDKRSGKSELTVRKESLTLPLAPNSWLTESVSSSSGINSPLSPVVNEKLVNELVQSLLNSKGLGYHKLPAEKLREAAIKSLYESCSDTSRACSPYNCSTDKSKHTSQDGDISQTDCYDSYDDNSVYYPGFDILPSRAFKNLQSGRSTPMNWPKCPLLPNQSPDPPNPNTLNSTQDAPHDR